MAIAREAWFDLVGRYAKVMAAVWRDRRSLDPKGFSAREAEFLPAALALQESPVSPAPRVAMWTIAAFAACALAWAVFGRMDIVANATGKIITNDRTKVIQSVETAQVHAIHVRNGQVVKAGELLIELDATISQADQERSVQGLASARWDVERARALLDAIDSGRAPKVRAVVPEDTEGQRAAQRLTDGQYQEYTSRLARIDAEVARREAERVSTQQVVSKLEQTLPIARQRAADYKDLAEKNYVSQHGYLEREQAHIEQQSDLALQRSRMLEIDASLRESRQQRHALVAETRRTMLAALDDASRNVRGLEQEVVKTDARKQMTRLVAPVSGTAQQLAVHTVGGVVTPGQPLVSIVPLDEEVEVEAYVENKDIGFVRDDQNVEVKIDTFPYTKYGTVPARIASVSGDAVPDERLGLMYPARVQLMKSSLWVDGKSVRLSPGMAVNVEVKIGTRRVIEYFLSPLLQYSRESLRER